jgi:hypothetical protein
MRYVSKTCYSRQTILMLLSTEESSEEILLFGLTYEFAKSRSTNQQYAMNGSVISSGVDTGNLFTKDTVKR